VIIFGITLNFVSVNLPDGMYTVKTSHDQPEQIQEFVIVNLKSVFPARVLIGYHKMRLYYCIN